MSQIPPSPLVVKLSADTGPFMRAIDELSQLLVNAPDAFRERLSAALDRFDDLVGLDNDRLSAARADESLVTLKPSKIMDLIVTTARTGEFDLSVFDFLSHDSSSVGCFGDSNEGRAPAESQGSVGACARRTQEGSGA